MTRPTVAEILDLEAAHPGATSAKAMEIRRRWALREARYYQLRNRAVTTREALEHDPITTRRILDSLDRNRTHH